MEAEGKRNEIGMNAYVVDKNKDKVCWGRLPGLRYNRRRIEKRLPSFPLRAQ